MNQIWNCPRSVWSRLCTRSCVTRRLEIISHIKRLPEKLHELQEQELRIALLRIESDWNYCYGVELQRLHENMDKIWLERSFLQRYCTFRCFNDAESSIMLTTRELAEEMPWREPLLEKMAQRVRLLEKTWSYRRLLLRLLRVKERCFSRRLRNEPEMKLHVGRGRERERKARRKARRMEKGERLDMERQRRRLRFATWAMLRSFCIRALATFDTPSCLIQQAYMNATFLDANSSAGNDITIGSHTIHAPKYLSVRNPLIHRSIFNMAKFSPNVCGANWISATPNLESINAGTGFEFNVWENFGKSNKPTEDQSQHNSFTDDDAIFGEHPFNHKYLSQMDQCRCSIAQAFIQVVRIFRMGGIGKTTLSELLTPKHMMSVGHPLIQMVLFARKKFEDMSSSINFMGPENIFNMACRLCSFAVSNVCGVGMGCESVLKENIARSRNNLTENEAQRNSGPESCGAEHGTKAVTTEITSASWVAATAAPHHATGNRDILNGFVTEHDHQFVHAVDGVPMPVKARGAVVTDAVVLPDVWFVPGLKSNMVSVIQLAELGYSIGFGCGDCCIRSAGDGMIVGKVRHGKDGLYKLDFLKVSLAM